MDHPNYIRLSPPAKALLFDLGQQYNGKNNGNLCAAFALMKKRGWRSRTTVDRAVDELIHYGLILKTRQGGRNAPNLHALTWQAIDDCNGKLDEPPTDIPPGNWKETHPDFDMPNSKKISLPCPADGQPLPSRWAIQGTFHANLPKN